MRKAIIGITLLSLPLVTMAYAAPQESQLERGVDIAIKGAKIAWSEIEKRGKPYAQELVSATPKYYASAQKSLEKFAKKVQKGELGESMLEKKRILLELWNLRSSINVLSLLNPQTLKQLTGYEVPELEKMQVMLKDTETRLKKVQFPGV